MQPHQERVAVEYRELTEKVEKLAAFLRSEKIKTVDFEEQVRLERQFGIMQQYKSILEERLAYFDRVNHG